MEAKKNPKADLEKARNVFFLIGLLIAVGAVLVAFNISTETSTVDVLDRPTEQEFETEIVKLIRPEEKKVLTPPKPKVELSVINMVDDDEQIEEELLPQDTEGGEDEEINFRKLKVEQTVEEPEEPILVIAAVSPQFPGGELGLRKWVANQIVYPTIAREAGIEGKVYLRFVVTKNGTVDRVSIARGVDPSLDKEAMRVVKKLPKWKPGENNGRKVSVWYTMPIHFKLK